jgi:hypothetical protein
MRKLWLVVSLILLSSIAHAFDFCTELEKAIEACRLEVQAANPNFDAYLSHCDVRETVYDTVDHVFVPIREEGEEGRVQVEALGNTILRFKFSKCLQTHAFNIKFKEGR